ncbi:MAG: NAD(P)/FAD-dependent oxidoreductase [Balneolaceae bacterium]|nr:NAD(P)/FAD-dependent oxidoreductase [Balneolaceae bacterium]
MKPYDAVIVGGGPNGLAAAIRLANRGLSTLVIEAEDSVGGGTRTAELTQPGFRHDVCSAIHPMAAASPFLSSLPLDRHGLEWITPPVQLAHPLDERPAACLYRSLDRTADELEADGPAWRKLVGPLADHWESMAPDLMAPLSLLPAHPLRMAAFGLKALRPAESLALSQLQTVQGKALFGGLAAHGLLPFDRLATSAIGLVLGAAAHVTGWPLPRGGSHTITRAMASYLKSLGGEIRTGWPVERLEELPGGRVTLFDLTPRQVLDIAGDAIPSAYREKLKAFRYGAGVFKLDLALDGPIPWRDERCRRAGTVHLGGELQEMAAAERETADGGHPDRPYVLLAQQSLFDETRAPEGKHTCWAYCHTPNGSTVDMSEAILKQIERFAPGFRDLVIGTHAMNAMDMQAYNRNYIGGDINGGSAELGQLFRRPARFMDPYRIPGGPLFFCSSSTPPGGGVHGMCGFHAAGSALRYLGV